MTATKLASGRRAKRDGENKTIRRVTRLLQEEMRRKKRQKRGGSDTGDIRAI